MNNVVTTKTKVWKCPKRNCNWLIRYSEKSEEDAKEKIRKHRGSHLEDK